MVILFKHVIVIIIIIIIIILKMNREFGLAGNRPLNLILGTRTVTLKRERVLTGGKARHLIASLGTIPIEQLIYIKCT